MMAWPTTLLTMACGVQTLQSAAGLASSSLFGVVRGVPRRKYHDLHRRMAVEESSGNNNVAAQDVFATLDSEICLVPGEVAVRVDVVPGNARRIYTGVDVLGADVDVVYGLLTDYESLGDVVPNLVANDVIDRRDGGARLRQVGAAQVLPGLNFRASMVLDVRELPDGLPENEFNGVLTTPDGSPAPLKRGAYPRPWAAPPPSGAPRRDVAMLSVAGEPGDFTLYQGVWRAQALPECAPEGRNATRLTFSVEIQPRPWLPVALVESRIARDLVTNMEAVSKEATRRATRQHELRLARSQTTTVVAAGEESDAPLFERELGTPHPDLVVSAKEALVAKVERLERAGLGTTRAFARDVARAATRLRQANALTGRAFSYDANFLTGRWSVRYSSDVANSHSPEQQRRQNVLPSSSSRARGPLFFSDGTGRRRNVRVAPRSRRLSAGSLKTPPAARAATSSATSDDDDDDDDASTTTASGTLDETRLEQSTSRTASVRRAATRAARAAGRFSLKSMEIEIRQNAYDTLVALKAPFATVIPPPRVRVEHLVIAAKRPFAATMVQERVRLEPTRGAGNFLPRPAVPSSLLQPFLNWGGNTRLLNFDVLYADDRHLVTLSEHGDLKICERLSFSDPGVAAVQDNNIDGPRSGNRDRPRRNKQKPSQQERRTLRRSSRTSTTGSSSSSSSSSSPDSSSSSSA